MRRDPFLTTEQLKRSISYLYALGSYISTPHGCELPTVDDALVAVEGMRDCGCGGIMIPGNDLRADFSAMPIFMCPICKGKRQRRPDCAPGVDLRAAESKGIMSWRFIGPDGKWMSQQSPEPIPAPENERIVVQRSGGTLPIADSPKGFDF